MPFYCEYVCFSCRQPWDIQTGWRRRWRTGTGSPASRLCVTLIRRPGNPSTSHLSKYLPLTLCCSYFPLLCGNIAADALNARPFSDALAGRLQSNAFHDNHGFFCSASYESVQYQFSACAFFSLLFPGNNNYTTGKHGCQMEWFLPFRFGHSSSLSPFDLRDYCAPHAAVKTVHPCSFPLLSPRGLLYLARPVSFSCLHCVFKIAFCFFCLSEHHVVCCMHSNLNFLWNLLTPYSW